MSDSLLSRIQFINEKTLAPIVQRATGCGGALTHWETAPIKVWIGGLGQNAIYRYWGEIQNGKDEISWSLILKVISSALPEKGPQIKEPEGNQREYEFYQSDLNRQFPDGFRAAHCYGLLEQVNGKGLDEYWLWLEDLSPHAKSEWTLEDHYQAAISIGKFNGVWMNLPLPDAPWLKRDHVKQYVEQAAPYFQRLFEQRIHAYIRRMIPPAEVESLAELWQRREEYLSIFQKIPHTLCHGDAQYTNLFLIPGAHGDVETVVIDWESVGLAPIGMDLAPALMMNLFRMDEKTARDLDQVLFQGYLEGLRAIGWRGDPRMIRLGYTSAIPRVRAAYVVRPLSVVTEQGVGEWLQHWLDEWGITPEEWADRSAWIHSFLRQLFEESLALRDRMF